ncbi:MAG: ProQ/FINO family protein [Endozoicomonas sp.]
MTSAKSSTSNQSLDLTERPESSENSQALESPTPPHPATPFSEGDYSHLPEEARKILARLESRPQSDVMNTEALRLVRILWPEAFNVSSPKPLKIGIHKEMEAAHLLPDHIIPIALRFFTTMERYLENIKPGAPRVNLKGEHAGRVRLREAVDAEIKLFTQSSDFVTTRDRVIIKEIRLLSVTKSQS